MHTTKLNILILVLVTLLSCNTGLTSLPKQSIFFIKDKDGLYLYDPITSKEKIIFKASDKQVFLDQPVRLSGDTVTFGIKGELVFEETSPNESGGERYFEEYYSVDMQNGKNWRSGKILYTVIGHSTLNVKTLAFDRNGRSKILSDTTMIYEGSSTTSKGTVYNDFKPRFFSKQSLGNKSVFSKEGSIYYTENSDTTLLVKYQGHFDPKFGSGYFQPQFDPTGQYVIFRYLPGFMNFKEGASLQKASIATKKIETLLTGEFHEPRFSKDGNFILFSREEKKGKSNAWNSKIYMLDLTKRTEKKIGEAYSAQWVK